MQVEGEGDFLGKLWVPITLGSVALIVVFGISFARDAAGFALAGIAVATSFLLRFTWDKRGAPRYWLIVILLLAIHLIGLWLSRDYLTRAPGGIFMLAALIDGLLMTFVVNSLVKGR